jgi:hypothetical protein
VSKTSFESAHILVNVHTHLRCNCAIAGVPHACIFAGSAGSSAYPCPLHSVACRRAFTQALSTAMSQPCQADVEATREYHARLRGRGDGRGLTSEELDSKPSRLWARHVRRTLRDQVETWRNTSMQ